MHIINRTNIRTLEDRAKTEIEYESETWALREAEENMLSYVFS